MKSGNINLYYIKSDLKKILSKLCTSLFDKNFKILLKTGNSFECDEIDRFLWTFEKLSFLPHGPYSSEDNSHHPITLTYQNLSEIKNLDFFDMILITPSAKEKKIFISNKIFFISYFRSIQNCQKDKLCLSSLDFTVKTFIELNNSKWKQI